MRIEIQQNLDETGEPEELTWDLFPVVPSSETLHLGETGLPNLGTRIEPGMIIVGKIGKTRDYHSMALPTCLEIHVLALEELRAKYGRMWANTSLYADQGHSGTVRDARIERRGDSSIAVVHIESDT